MSHGFASIDCSRFMRVASQNETCELAALSRAGHRATSSQGSRRTRKRHTVQ